MKDIPIQSVVTATIVMVLVSTLVNGFMIKLTLVAIAPVFFGDFLGQVSQFAVFLGCILGVCLSIRSSSILNKPKETRYGDCNI